MKIRIFKFLLATIGRILPLRRHPGGKTANKIRCFFVKHIVKSMDEGCSIDPGTTIDEECVLGAYTRIGPKCEIGRGTVFEGHNFTAPNIHIFTQNHIYDTGIHNFNGISEVKPVIVGKHTWIGYGAIILPGVVIGNNTIIGAGSVVTKNIPSGVLAAGNPCVVKKIIDQDIYQGNSCK